MTTRPAETKAALLESAVGRVRERLEGDEADDVERFVRAYYANAAPDDLVGRNDLDVYGAAMAHWRLARLRRPGELKVNVYNPNVEEHGWESPYTVVETVIADMPFLVDSVTMEVTRHGSAIHLAARPIMRLRRDEEGRLLEAGGEDGEPESLIHVEIDRITDLDALEQLRSDLERVLGDVAAAVEDWQAMRAEVHEAIAEIEQSPPPIPKDELEEARALLQWMHDDHFTFLGYREYEIRTEGGEDVLASVEATGLGILRVKGEQPHSLSFSKLTPEVRRLAREKTLLNLTKANSRATVHRPAYLDYVGVKRFDADGEVASERRFLGLFTHTVYSAGPWEIPLLRRKVQSVLDRSGLLPGSHDHKAMIEILETYPRDELFQITPDELLEFALGILHLGERRRVRLFVRRDVFGRFLSCLVFIPRERFNTENRRKVQEILQEAFGWRERRLHHPHHGVRARAAPLRRLHRAGVGARLRRGGDRGATRRRHARLDGRPPRRPRGPRRR